jgi:hypothetical protein
MKVSRTLFILALVFVGAAASTLSAVYYPYVFSRTVKGEVVAIERVTAPSMIITGSGAGLPSGAQGNPPGNSVSPAQIYSFAIAIRESGSREIVTASSEDRQWAVVQKGQCAEAKFFPYPPWKLDKSGTYFGARLIGLTDAKDCPDKTGK